MILRSPARLASTLLITSIPALATALLVYIRFRATLLDFQPSWNDEIFYWHQILSFAATGLGNGYYVFNELPARAGFSHYGPHGPLFPALYGSIGRIVGWHPYSGPLFNLALVALSTLVFLGSTPALRRHRLKVGLILLTFWPLLLYLPSNMQESLHAAAAILFAAIFYRLLSSNGAVPAWQLALFAAVIFLFALMRPTWSLLFLPLFLLSRNGAAPRKTVLSCVAAGVLTSVVFVVFQWLSAPYPNFMSNLADGTQQSSTNSLKLFVAHFAGNLRGLVDFRNGAALEVLLRYQVLVALLLFTVVASRRSAPRMLQTLKTNSTTTFHLLNLGIPVVFVLLFYDVTEWRDYRVLAPHLLLSLLLWSVLAQSRLVYFITATNVLFALAFALAFSRIHAEQFTQTGPGTVNWGQLLTYQPEKNAWCNTLLTDAVLDRRLMGVPAGTGLSFVLRAQELKAPLQSRYLLLGERSYNLLKERIRVELMRKTEMGSLYRNLDCRCDGEGNS